LLVGSVPEALWGRLFALFRTFIIAVTLHGDSVSVWFRFDAKTQKCLWDRTSAYHYTILFVVVGLLLPFVVTVISYWRIFVHIQRVRKRVLLSQFQARPPDIANKTRMQWRSEGCGPHRAALVRGGKRAKIVFLMHVKIQIVISYAFACNENKALQLQCVPILSIIGSLAAPRFDFVGITPILCRGRSIPNISPFFP